MVTETNRHKKPERDQQKAGNCLNDVAHWHTVEERIHSIRSTQQLPCLQGRETELVPRHEVLRREAWFLFLCNNCLSKYAKRYAM